MADGPPAPARKPKKVPRYDEYGNYLGDVREDELQAIEAAAAKQRSPPPPVAPADAPSLFPPNGAARPAPMAAPKPTRRPVPRPSGPLYYCGLDTTLLSQPSRCTFAATSELELMLHRADRHLVYPPGGMDELRRRDPMRIAEEREHLARQRKGNARAADGPSDSTILGLNIKLDTPELIEEWIRQRKKRFPTAALIEQKHARIRLRELPRSNAQVPRAPSSTNEASGDPSFQAAGPPSTSASDASLDAKRAPANQSHAPDTSSGSSDSDTDSDSSSESSNSDMDPVRDAVSSKLDPSDPPASEERNSARTPQHPSSKRASTDGETSLRPKRRAVPRRAAPNPFEVPDLLRQLLEREILQHVDALAQWLDFVLDNNFLASLERHRGEAAAQRARRARVTDLSAELAAPVPGTGTASTAALPPVASPPLRALDELLWPDEPDPLIYLDPLRAADPKPLRLSELETLAMDPTLRAILQPTSSLHPRGEDNHALRRALETWRALPTSRHREAALQLILGVGADSPVHAHEAYAPAYQRVRGAPRGTHMQQGRVIGETELFRLGLRVSPVEVREIQHMAERVAAVTARLEYETL